MTESSYPFDNADTNETQYSQIFRRLIGTGVWGSPGGTELKPFGDGSGLQVKVPAGSAFVRGHYYVSDAQTTKTLVAAEASPRIDTLCLELNPTANTILQVVVKGTAGAGVGPTLTQTDAAVWQEPLCDIAVGASVSVINSGNVTDRRRFVGENLSVWSTSTRPSSPRPYVTMGFNVTTGKFEYHNGTTWVDLISTSVDPANLSAAVPISKGGTGATTKAGGLNALGIWISATEPAGAVDGDLWFW